MGLHEQIELRPALRLSMADAFMIGGHVSSYVRIYSASTARRMRAELFQQIDKLATYRRQTKRWKEESRLYPSAYDPAAGRFVYFETQRQIARTANKMAKQRGHRLP